MLRRAAAAAGLRRLHGEHGPLLADSVRERQGEETDTGIQVDGARPRTRIDGVEHGPHEGGGCSGVDLPEPAGAHLEGPDPRARLDALAHHRYRRLATGHGHHDGVAANARATTSTALSPGHWRVGTPACARGRGR